MAKIIIDNRSDLLIEECLDLIKTVVGYGRISNNNTQYCYATTFKIRGEHYAVTTDLNKESDRFVVQNSLYGSPSV